MKELTKEQEDFVLEQGREKDFNLSDKLTREKLK